MITFEVVGRPVGQAALSRSKTGHTYFADKGLATWRARVVEAAEQAHVGAALDGPLSVTVIFQLARPKAHYDSKGALRLNAPAYATKRPDLDHLVRAVGDALSRAHCIADDARIVHWDATKMYGRPSALVVIRELDEGSKAA